MDGQPDGKPETDLQFSANLLQGDPFAKLSDRTTRSWELILGNHKPSKLDFAAVENIGTMAMINSDM